MKLLVVLFFSLFVSLNLFSQNEADYIRGKVVNSITYEALPFANIQINGTNRGWTTDLNGEFRLENLNTGEQLLVSYVGYKSVSIYLDDIKDPDDLVITLIPIEINLQEVTVYSKYTTVEDEIQSSNLSIQSKRIREIAPAMPDILRSVQSLPGIITNNGISI